MTNPIVLSYVQAETLLEARQRNQANIEVSPDLGISTVTVQVSDKGVVFPGDIQLDWQQITKIKKETSNCFRVEGDALSPIQTFSEYTNRMCSLFPTRRTPTMLIAGFTMHRIVDIDPLQDTLKKVATIAPIVGSVLDTATGLGYIVIEAVRTAQHVVTIELDPGAQQIARLNPWSQELFDNPKIT